MTSTYYLDSCLYRLQCTPFTLFNTFIKLHIITAQSCPVTLVILYHSHWFSPKWNQLYLLRRLLITRDEKGILSLQFFLKPQLPCASLAACLLFSKLSGSSATEPTLSCPRVFLFPSKSPTVPTSRLQHMLWDFLRFCSLVLFLVSCPWALVFSVMRRSRWGVGSCGYGCVCVCVCVYLLNCT